MRTVDLGQQFADRNPTFHRSQAEQFPEFVFHMYRSLATVKPNVVDVLVHVPY